MIVYILKFGALCMSLLFFLGISFGGSFEYTPLNFVSQWVDKVERKMDVNTSKGKAVVKNLYNNALEQIQYSQVSPVFQAVKQTTQSLNDQYLCTIKDEDVVNILYGVNSVLKKNIKNLGPNISTPTKNDMKQSCSKLVTCIFKSDKATTTPDSLSYCKSVANSAFVEQYANSYNISSIGDDNEGHDAFWNGSLSDSSYDILNDINVLSKILFDSVEEPAEVMFYEMPTVSILNEGEWTAPAMQNDWYSPYYVPVDNPEDDEGDGDGPEEPDDPQNPPEDPTGGGPNPVVGDGDDDFHEFVSETTYYVEGQEGYSFLGNDCIDGFEIEGYDGYSYTVTETGFTGGGNTPTPTTYQDDLLNQINELACNHNGICDLWESPSCNECAVSGGGSQVTEDVQRILHEAPELLDDPEALSCFQSCSDQPCTATSCEKLTCYAKCLCISYETPFFDPAKYPGLGPVFKLKFCVQPVMDHKISTTKKVYNIATIFIELNNIIQDLRNSGDLMVNKKTKEFLEAGFSNNNFAKSFSVSVDSTKKVPQSKGSDKQEKENQINLNTTLMENILGFDEEETLDGNGRNKYIIKGTPTQDGALDLETSATPEYQEANIDELVSSLQTQHLSNVDSEISTFLESNENFWLSVKRAFEDMNDIAKSLVQKKGK